MNILDLVLEKVWDPLDDIVFVRIGASGLYAAVQAFSASGGDTER